jgi:hypothetical protein
MGVGGLDEKPGYRGGLVIAALVGAFVLGAPPQARADDPPEDIPAVGAYVELIPTAGGSKQAGRRQKGRALPLSETARSRLESAGGTDAPLLERIATAPELGAPTKRLALSPRREEPDATAGSDPGIATSVSDIGRTVAGGSDARLLLLIGLLGGLTLAAVAVTVRRARSI